MTGTGKIHIYYGNGKGKTTAAVGQVIRAAGRDLKVLVFQFLKNNSSGERKILEQVPNITCLPGRDRVKFYNQMNGEEKAELKHYNTKALDEIVKFCSPFDVLFLDEILCAVKLNLLNEDKLMSFLQHKPRGLEIIMTGHEVSDRMLELADYATEMVKVKHPYDHGTTAREGIEF
ncbi:cob(I)yrinic acid a,c-diamide adenosyltransferase [Lachnospiraceae bacterium KGMB03038]|nr:cob(I)yrinic acid a,c-diamide adenosyltransferase [Lachnospiraceae bacterium KGMB03038]